MLSSKIAAFCLLAAPAWSISLPELTGPHSVGTVSFQLTDYARLDPITPESGPRSIMVSAFYPSLGSESKQYPLAPVFTPKQASWMDKDIGLQNETMASVSSQSRLGAPISTNSQFPLLLFSHGSAMSRELHTSALEDLASHGWVIIAISHTGDANFVEFPDGSTVINNGTDLYPPFSEYPGSFWEAADIRVADMLFLIGGLKNRTIASHIPGLDTNLPSETIGAFGHSFGGAAALQMLENATNVAAAANLDGTQLTPLYRTGTEMPVVIMDTPDGNVTCCDASWNTMWPLLTGYRREATVANTTHASYTDYVIFKDIPEIGMPPEWVSSSGDIRGTRMREIQTQYLDAYFGKWLKEGNGKLLDRNSTAYPEVLMHK